MPEIELVLMQISTLKYSGMFRSATQLGRRNAKWAVSALHSSTFTFHSRRPQCQVSSLVNCRQNKIAFLFIIFFFFCFICLSAGFRTTNSKKEFIAQLVLHKSGCDPDFSAYQEISIRRRTSDRHPFWWFNLFLLIFSENRLLIYSDFTITRTSR